MERQLVTYVRIVYLSIYKYGTITRDDDNDVSEFYYVGTENSFITVQYLP